VVEGKTHWLKLNKNSWPVEAKELSPENVPEKQKHTVIAVAV